MAERRPQSDSLPLEQALAELGARLDIPATPDLAGAVRVRLDGAEPRRGRLAVRSVRWTWAAAAIFAALLLTALVLGLAPGVREAVADRFGLRGVWFFPIGDGSGPPAVTLTPASAPADGSLSLGEAVSLAEAQARVSFSVLVPESLGPPDEVYAGEPPAGGQVTLVYRPRSMLPEARETGVAVLLMQFRGESEPFIRKGLPAGASLTPVTVNGRPAYWIEGVPHVLVYRESGGLVREERSRLAGNTLLWERNGITYRMESALSRDAAVRIAESLR